MLLGVAHTALAAQPAIGLNPIALTRDSYFFDTAEQHGIRVDVVVRGLNHPFSLALLPTGDALVSERGGNLRLVRNATGQGNGGARLEPQPVAGVPVLDPAYRNGGLHDVVLHPGEYIRMIEFELYIDNEFVYRQRSDGLIISTPTGSTAYALSVGGPIMHPGLDAIVVVPLNPHTLSSRPIVVHGDAEIRVVVGDQRDIRPHVTCDGQTHQVTTVDDEIVVRKKPEKLRLIHPEDHDFYEICRNKLGWASHSGNGFN